MALHGVVAVQIMAALYELTRGAAFPLAVGIVLLAGAVGVYRRLRWGRVLAIITMWFLLLFAVGSIFPETVDAGRAPGVALPSAEVLGAQLVILSCLALASLHVLSRHKARFRSGWF